MGEPKVLNAISRRSLEIKDPSKNKALGTIKKGIVKEEEFLESKIDQLWIQGNPNTEGYFTLKSSVCQKFMKARSSRSIRVQAKEKVVPPPIWDCLSIFTEMLNSCVNVVIYASFGKQFRKTFFELFCSPCQKGNQVGPGQVLELKENSSSKTNSATNNTGMTSASS